MSIRPNPEQFAAPVARMAIEQEIERLIALLDDMDGDVDAEPWLGAPEAPSHVWGWGVDPAFTQERWAGGGGSDAEEDAGEQAERLENEA